MLFIFFVESIIFQKLFLSNTFQPGPQQGQEIPKYRIRVFRSKINNFLLKTVKNRNYNIQVGQNFAYQFNNFFQLGVGTGIDFWKHTAFVPLYLNLRVNMMQTKVAPTAFINLGWSFKWYISSRPEVADRVIHGATWGPMSEVGIGMRIKLNDQFGLLIAGTYKLQYSNIRYSIIREGETDFSADMANSIQPALYHFAGVKLGFTY